MDNETKWLGDAAKALSFLLQSEIITELDRAIFGAQAEDIFVGKLVSFPDCEDIHFKRIRSNRLKLLGYTWHAESKRWIKVLP